MKDNLEYSQSSVLLSEREPIQSSEEPNLSNTYPITDDDILAYLRRSAKIAEITALAKQDALILATCEQHGITVSEEELQVAGDAFRLEHKLLGSAETFAWLMEQQISLEAWSDGIRVALLTQKLKEHLFGGAVDGSYISNRDHYRRIALSQILVLDLAIALKIVQSLQANPAAFCTLALEYSKGKQSQENGGFVGVRFVVELMPDIVEAVTNAQEGEVIGPVQTRLGYHILRVEKWFPSELTELVRAQILDSLFQMWLRELNSKPSA